jgi:hypothetical protein
MAVEEIKRFRNGAAALGRFALAAMLSGLMAGPVMGGEVQVWSAGFSLVAGPGDETPAAMRWARSAGTPRAAGRMIVAPGTHGGWDGIPVGSETRPVFWGEVDKAQRPPVKTGKVTAQILAGVGVTAGMFALSILTASESTLDDDEAMQRRATAWEVFGGAALTPLVVYLIGNQGPQQGSLGKTYLYGAIGAAAGGALLFLAFEGASDAVGILALTVSTFAPAIGAVIGYNASRRYDDPAPVQSALLNVGGGKLRLGLPAPMLFVSGPGRKSPGLAIRIFEAEL